MTCPGCGGENRADARFCLQCGRALAPACPGCGRELPPGARFCDGCGARLASAGAPPAPHPPRDPRSYTPKHLAERILVSKSALEGERKHVTVLFADLSDSTRVSERVGPEEMHALLDRCFQRMLAEVHRFEGTVNQFTGDGIMALFGAPVALEDAPRRAVLAALAMQRALAPVRAELSGRVGFECGLRIGIHAGTVVVGRIGDDLRMDYTAIGDTTHLADRLQKLAPPGGVVISAATERLVGPYFELRALAPTTLRGFARPVRAFEVLGERAVSGRLEAVAETALTPYVGRERELAALRAAFESARQGRGQVAFLVGEAGLGKSRLLHEFRRGLAGEPHGWIEGRCASFARDAPFHPIADALRRAFAIGERDDDAAALAKLERAEAEQGGGLAWTLPYLRQLLSLPAGDAGMAELDAATRRSETFRALQARLLRAAGRAPLVLVVEDLHWIDAASEELLGYLADSLPAARALLVFTHRPGYRHPFGDRSYHARIALQSLSPRDSAAMAASLFGTARLPAEVERTLLHKAEGNPFFVEEVTKSLLEEGALRREGDRVVLARDLSQIAVPESIQDVLMARIDRLADEPKRAIQVASVIGREFALRLLERIHEAGDGVAGLVHELRALELIHEKAIHPELAFMFKHALTHEVAYDSVLVQRRKALHSLVGRAIEELYRDRLVEHYESLAHHFSVAEDWERALRYHELASQKAVEAYANPSAAEHCRRALAIADRLGEAVPDERRREVAERLGYACWLSSAFAASGEAYARAAAASATPDARARNLARAALSFFWSHDARGRACAEEGLALSRRERLPAEEGMALAVIGFDAGVLRGELGRCAELNAEAARLASGDDEASMLALHFEGEAKEWQGDYRRAIELQEHCLEIARRTRRPDSMIMASWFLAKANGCLGRYAEALAQLQQAVELSERVGDRAWKARLLNTLGWCFAEFGCFDRAIECNRQSTLLAREMVELALVPGAPELYGNAAINLACNRIALGDPAGALEHLEPIRQALETDDDPWMRWRYGLHLLDARARHALATGEPERALALLDEELAGARRHGARKLVARALELRGRALVGMDERAAAEAALRTALELGRRIEYPPVVWRALSLLAELARRADDAPGRERLAGEARSLVEGLVAAIPVAERSTFRGLGERLVTDPLAAYL
jgi:class 3 adenylate cyclase/tetratricopeptide (TPR) repeat protein